MNPSSAQNFHYRDIVNVFKKYDTWSQMIFYCKPYCKVQSGMDKKNAVQNQFGGTQMMQQQGYQDTISKPAFIAQEKVKEKEIFLNGEVNSVIKKTTNYNAQQGEKNIKKTMLCLKGLMVDNNIAREAVKNYYNLTNSNDINA